MMMNKFLSFLALALFLSYSSTPACAQEGMPKKYQGLLWEISGNGLKSKSYLYGTMHVSNKLAFHLSDSFFVALNKCEMVALELDFSEWMDDFVLLNQAEEEMFFTEGSGRTSSFYRSAFKMTIPAKDELQLLLKSNPQIINQMLYRNSGYKNDFEEDNYLDIFIYQAGKKQNKKVIGLENFNKTEMFSYMASLPEKMTKKERERDQEEREQMRLKLKELKKDGKTDLSFENAYRMGNLDLLDTLNQLQTDKRYTKYMLVERNKIMAHRMDSIIRNNTMFTGVGAAHLPGKFGVIELLRAKGYKLRPVAVTSKNDIKLKNDIDEKHFPVTFTVKQSDDSLFTVKTPGKLYTLSESGPYKSYLCNDMANGSYYYIQRMNHYGMIKGLNQQEVLLRIDSLLYENIPGKILSKKEIKSNTGWPGYEIMNKTRKGDHQQYNIYVSPDEIIIFKMNGPNEYLKTGTEAAEFFSSIQFSSKSGNNKTLNLDLYGLKANMYDSRLVYVPVNQKYSQQAIVTSGNGKGSYKMLMVAGCNDYSYIEEDTFELNMLSQRVALETGLKIKSVEPMKQGKLMALQNKLSIPGAKTDSVAYMRIIINGPQYYLALMVTGSKTEAETYFNSLSIEAPAYKPVAHTYSDSLMHFNVTLDYKYEPYNAMVYKTSNKGSAYSRIINAEDEKENVYSPVQMSRTFFSRSLTENVNVMFNKFSMFFQEDNKEDLWKKELASLAGDSKMKVRRIDSKSQNGYETLTCMVTDTNSSRGILVKYYLKCATMYRLKTVVDTNVLLSPFKKSFYDSFVPADTCIGRALEEDKLTEFFFNKIYSSDTTESKKASNIANYVENNLREKHVPVLLSTLRNKKFHELPADAKPYLISSCSKFPTKEVIAFLDEFYTSLTDSTQLQMRILYTLAKSKTADATKTFLKLINQDLPVTSDIKAIEKCFRPFYDSLELAKPLFPGIIKYAQYREYKYTLYKLLVTLTEKDLVKPKVYSAQTENIALDATYDLKIYLADKKKDYDSYDLYNYSSSDDEFAYNAGINDDFIDFFNGVDEKLIVYAGLLAPYYDKPLVKKFFTRMMKAPGDDNLKVYTNGLLLKNHVTVYDTAWKSYSASLKYRYSAFRTLSRYNSLGRFDKQYLSQEAIVPAMLFNKSFTAKKDTFALVRKIKVTEDGKAGLIYVYKSKPKDKKNWKLNMSGSHPAGGSSTLVNNEPYIQRTQIAYNGDQLMEKEITLAMRKIRIKDRKRASLSDFESTNNNYSSYY